MNKLKKTLLFVLLDFIFICVGLVLTCLITQSSITELIFKEYLHIIIVFAITYAFAFILGLYSIMWRFAGFLDGIKILIWLGLILATTTISSIISAGISLSFAFIYTCIFGVFAILLRFGYRTYCHIVYLKEKADQGLKRIMIIGGGAAGVSLIKEMQVSRKLKMLPVCVLDDDENKKGLTIEGVKIVGKINEVKKYAEIFNVDEIIVSIPSISKKETSVIVKECQKTKCKIKIIPGIYQYTKNQISISVARDIDVSDLLGREQVKVDLDEIMDYIENKVVLVTGGGGSIGSELCRQLAKHNPKQLIVLDIYENNAYDIQQELLSENKNLNLEVIIASVRDSSKINSVFSKYKPNIVFHAAAHKHVPLMENSPNEAVKNNVSGTFKVADAAGRNNVEKFILISTDKAVNPTNIMGATKRICEMIIQTLNKKYDTEYVAVRFGNVLGSNGSVIPLFKKQIEKGGPVTITDKNIVRYFMTIPEAVSLVLQAGAYAKGGEIFVLDMGEQVKIYDLAINMIKLSGYEPFKDIDIVVTGLRPGEKLYEERLMAEEGLKKTPNEMISIGQPIVFDEKHLIENISKLYEAAYNETDDIKELVAQIVPTYKIDRREKN